MEVKILARKNIQYSDGSKIIGVCGCGNGVGTTHLSIMLGNYTSSKLMKKTAVIEMNDSQDFDRLAGSCKNLKVIESETGVKVLGEGIVFFLNGIDYYSRTDENRLLYIMNKDYEYIIIDLGNVASGIKSELLRCNEKIIIGSGALWKKQKFVNTVRELKKVPNSERWNYCICCSDKETQKNIENEAEISVKNIPYMPEAFYVDSSNFNFFESLLKK